MKKARIYTRDNGRIAVSITYDERTVENLKAIPGRHWNPDEKMWYFPNRAGVRGDLVRALEGYEIFEVDPSSLDALSEEMRSRKYSRKTIASYLYFNRDFIEYCGKEPAAVDLKDLRGYLAWLERHRKYTSSGLNLALSALKFHFGVMLGKAFVLEKKRPRKDRLLPKVLNREEVLKLLGALSNLKHRTLLTLAYSAGLRVSEVVRLKLNDIDRERRLIHIRRAKGRKDRYSLLAEKAIRLISEYVSLFRPSVWLFEGQWAGRPLSLRTAQTIFKHACRAAGIDKDVSIHCLRHSFATHLLEGGTDIRYIQELLGHAHTKTTEIYTHVAKRDFLRMKSPLDRIENDAL